MCRLITERNYTPLYEKSGISEYASGHMAEFNDYRCGKCKTEAVVGMKISRLIDAPRILALSFNKFLAKWPAEYPATMEV
jgi:hypothetical protein